MKEVEKLKKKLKRTKWLHENMNKMILGMYLPFAILNALLLPFLPWVAMGCMCVGCLSVVILGPIYLWRYYDSEYLHLIARRLAAAETANEENVEILSKSIEKYKDNPTMFIDKKHTKSLIKDLIKVKSSAQKALKEQKQEEMIELQDENELNI